MKILNYVVAVLLSGLAINAQARPFSTTDEIQYLNEALGKLSSAEEFQIVESSLTVESSSLDYVNHVLNFSPFRLILGPLDDRTYNVYFRVAKNAQSFAARVHFRTTDGAACPARNNTSAVRTSSISGRKNCLTLHISPFAWDLEKRVKIYDLLID